MAFIFALEKQKGTDSPIAREKIKKHRSLTLAVRKESP
jgi:hypothetical protein